MARAQPVVYSDVFPIVNPIIDDDMARMKKTIFTKSCHWKYEMEWRIVDKEKNSGTQVFPPEVLVGVIFGCRMTETDKQLVREWCQSRTSSFYFYHAEVVEGRFALEIVKV